MTSGAAFVQGTHCGVVFHHLSFVSRIARALVSSQYVFQHHLELSAFLRGPKVRVEVFQEVRDQRAVLNGPNPSGLVSNARAGNKSGFRRPSGCEEVDNFTIGISEAHSGARADFGGGTCAGYRDGTFSFEHSRSPRQFEWRETWARIAKLLPILFEKYSFGAQAFSSLLSVVELSYFRVFVGHTTLVSSFSGGER